ncbi:MAG: fatty acid desaturase family protein [Bacteroidia bacterium]
MNIKTARFNPNNGAEFYKILKSRVDEYFASKKISRNANAKMVIKTISMILIYILPYLALMIGDFSGWLFFAMWLIMGIGMAGIGLSVMHDANHEAYSKNKRVNTVLGYLVNFLGGHATNWKIQHNVLHHTYTNIDGLDEDINPGKILRFSPNAPKLKVHKYQHYYAWFFYSLMTIVWTLTKDFNQLVRYNKQGLVKAQRTTLGKELAIVIVSKLIYYALFIALPIILLSTPWWMVVVGMVIKHLTAGLILSAIFQPAHVMETSEYNQPEGDQNLVPHNWAVHQLFNTTNYAPNNKILSWYAGGLNYQIEHHLFPSICHIHYSELSPIVEKTAKEFNLPYNVEPTFRSALINHAKMLKELGRVDMPAMA